MAGASGHVRVLPVCLPNSEPRFHTSDGGGELEQTCACAARIARRSYPHTMVGDADMCVYAKRYAKLSCLSKDQTREAIRAWRVQIHWSSASVAAAVLWQAEAALPNLQQLQREFCATPWTMSLRLCSALFQHCRNGQIELVN